MKSTTKVKLKFKQFSIPLNLYKSTKKKGGVNFHLVSPCCEGRVGYQKYCKECGEEVEWSELKKGFKIGDDMKIFSREEVKELKPSSSDIIRILGFCEGIKDMRYLNGKVYYASYQEDDEVTDNQKRAFFLLREALREMGLYAIVKVTFRKVERLFLIKPFKQYLLFIGVRFKDEVRGVDRIPIRVKGKPKKEHKQMFEKIITKEIEAKGKSDIEDFENKSREKIKKLIEGEDVGELKEEIEKEKEEEMKDLLKQSLEMEEEKEKEKEKVKAK